MVVWIMDMNERKQQFSFAYVKAIAAVAGFATYRPSVDDDGVDLGMASRSSGGTIARPRLEMQVKCTEVAEWYGDFLHYELRKKNYDDLIISNLLVPRILVVVVVPAAPDDWLCQSEQQLSMRRCGYWLSLRAMPEVPNRASVTVHIPRRNIFSVDSLRDMMHRIGEGELP